MLDTLFLAFSLALALSMDAFAVALALACVNKKLRLIDYVGIPLAFGFFQFMMPLIGYFFSSFVQESFADYGSWIACILLVCIGGKMLKESLENKEEDTKDTDCPQKITLLCILFLAVATSIDALAIGISFAFTGRTIVIPSIIIGVVCFFCTLAALHLGTMLSNKSSLGKRAELFGACILIGIGLKIFFWG
ncbi:MAG: manganese efflux pump MntP family protein [Pseudomonadota bacterium]